MKRPPPGERFRRGIFFRKRRETDIWESLRDILAEETALPRDHITRDTVLYD